VDQEFDERTRRIGWLFVVLSAFFNLEHGIDFRRLQFLQQALVRLSPVRRNEILRFTMGEKRNTSTQKSTRFRAQHQLREQLSYLLKRRIPRHSGTGLSTKCSHCRAERALEKVPPGATTEIITEADLLLLSDPSTYIQKGKGEQKILVPVHSFRQPLGL